MDSLLSPQILALDRQEAKKVKHIFFTILIILIMWIGKTFAIILMYSSPDNIPHTLHGSIFVLGSAIFIFSVYYNINNPLHIVMKWILSIIGVYSTYITLVFSYVSAFSERIQDEIDISAAIIFFISALLMGTGTLLMIKNTRERIIHE